MAAKRKNVKSVTAHPVGELQDKFNRVLGELEHIAVSQGDLVHCMMLATLTGENVVFIGPPGCNKTAVIGGFTHLLGCDMRQELERRAANGEEIEEFDIDAAPSTFYATLDQTTMPEALVGPFSPRMLKEKDKWWRQTEGTLVTAEFAVLEELFNANGALLQSIHRPLNEHEFENAGVRQSCPLITCFAATNREPQDHRKAIYDRFLFRHRVGYLNSSDRDSFLRMLELGNQRYQLPAPILSLEEVKRAQEEVARVTIDDSIKANLYDLRSSMLSEKKGEFSDRRWVKAESALKASAWLQGSATVEPFDLYAALRFILWDREEQRIETLKILDQYKSMTSEGIEETWMANAENIYNDALALDMDDPDNYDGLCAACVEINNIGMRMKTQKAINRCHDMQVEVNARIAAAPEE